VLTVCGGYPAASRNIAFDLAKGGITYGGERHLVEVATQAGPTPRTFGAGCSLRGGSVLLYGGWHPRGGSLSDFWVGHSDGDESDFFQRVPETTDEAQEPARALFTDFDIDVRGNTARALLLSRLLAGDRLGAHEGVFRMIPRHIGDSDEEDSDALDEEDEEDDDEDADIDEVGNAAVAAAMGREPSEVEDEDEAEEEEG